MTCTECHKPVNPSLLLCPACGVPVGNNLRKIISGGVWRGIFAAWLLFTLLGILVTVGIWLAIGAAGVTGLRQLLTH